MHFQDEFTATNIGQRYDYLAIKSARSQQRRIQNVRPVGGCDNDDAFGAFETIHLNQHLIQGLLTLIVPTTETSATMSAILKSSCSSLYGP